MTQQTNDTSLAEQSKSPSNRMKNILMGVICVLLLLLVVCSCSKEGMAGYVGGRTYGTFGKLDGMAVTAKTKDLRRTPVELNAVLPDLKFKDESMTSMHDMEYMTHNTNTIADDKRMRFTEARWLTDGSIAKNDSFSVVDGTAGLDQSGAVVIPTEIETRFKPYIYHDNPRSLSGDILKKTEFKPEYGMRARGSVTV